MTGTVHITESQMMASLLCQAAFILQITLVISVGLFVGQNII